MDRVSENGILSNEEFASYKQRSVRSRFMHQIFLGAGGATLFGVVGFATQALLKMAFVGSSISWGPMLGLAALGVAGLGCIYIGAKYLSQTILLDQDFQAKKIGLAARGVEPSIGAPGMTSRAATVEPVQSSSPTAALDTPHTIVRDVALQDKMVPLATAEKQAAPEEKATQSFVERTAANDTTLDAQKARA